MIKGIFKTYNPAGTFLLPLSNLTTVTCLIFLIVLHHMDTILVVLLVFFNLTLNLKLPNWMMTIFCRFYAYKYSPVNYVT